MSNEISNEIQLCYCKQCDDFLPPDIFRHPKEHKLCYKHQKEYERFKMRKNQTIRALNSYSTKAYMDMLTFGMKRINIKGSDMLTLLNPDQIANFTNWSMVPRRPDKEITNDNVAIITSAQRRYLVATWKLTKNSDEYESNLYNLLDHTRDQCWLYPDGSMSCYMLMNQYVAIP